MTRALRLLRSADLLARERDAAGAAGLAFQAIDLASKVLTEAIDGSDAGSHAARMRRVRDLTETDQRQLDFLWTIRQRDFYGDVKLGDPADPPSDDQVRDSLRIAREIIERIDAALHDDAPR